MCYFSLCTHFSWGVKHVSVHIANLPHIFWSSDEFFNRIKFKILCFIKLLYRSPQFMQTIEPRVVSIFCTLSNLFQTHVMLGSGLRSPPKHTPLKHRCPFTCTQNFRAKFCIWTKKTLVVFRCSVLSTTLGLLANQTHCTKTLFGNAIFDEFF